MTTQPPQILALDGRVNWLADWNGVVGTFNQFFTPELRKVELFFGLGMFVFLIAMHFYKKSQNQSAGGGNKKLVWFAAFLLVVLNYQIAGPVIFWVADLVVNFVLAAIPGH